MKNILILLILITSCNSNNSIKKIGLLEGHKQETHESYSDNIMIATQGEHSTQAGLKMLELGGNAFDAATAISFAISVERPQSTGIGGGGFMLLDGPKLEKPIAVDFREKAPLLAHAKMYLDKNGEPLRKLPIDGILASGVPGIVKGVLEVQRKYGKLSLAQVIQPAINLARNGFIVYPHLEKSIKMRRELLLKYPASKKIFFNGEDQLKTGDLIKQEDLARTLEAIKENGADGFYKGWVAKAITDEFKRQGGLITQDDLDKYNVIWREPITGTYKDYEVFSMPPPSSGGTHIIEILNLLEPMNLKSKGPQSSETLHKTATAMQLAFVDRARYMGDSDFVKVPTKALSSKKYANELRKKITNKALKITSDELIDAFAYESNETTHFTVMDKEGNVISSTQTINYLLGSGVVVPGTGIVMNDEMDDFSIKEGASNVFGAVGGKNNLVEPQKRPLSSMSPTIIKKNGKTVLALGTPSGTRILTCVMQVAFNYIEHKMSLWDAVAATRIHHQWSPDEIRVGDPGFKDSTIKELEERGHEIKRKNLGCKIQAIAVENGKLHGVSDPRGEGMAKGI